MIEVRFHGRGGQGAVTASRILANAFVRIGKYGASFPMFGFERRGAPVTAFGRFSDTPVREKTQIYNPDILVVLDPAQRQSPPVFKGLAVEGVMVLNDDEKPLEHLDKNLVKVGIVDADKIAIEEIGFAMPNTCIIGAFAATTGLIELEPVLESLGDYFDGKKLEANIRCAKRGFKEVEVFNFV